MMSYLFNGQWSTDKNVRKYKHMSIIPFPVCAYAAIKGAHKSSKIDLKIDFFHENSLGNNI